MSVEGEIKGRLVLDSDQFRRDILAAREQLADLTSQRTSIDVRANTTAARSELDATSRSASALTAAEGRLQAALRDVERAVAVAAATQGRLNATQKDLEGSAARAATAEEALKSALDRETAAAARATAAETALKDAREKSTVSVKDMTRSADSGAGRIALLTSAVVAAAPALFPIAGLATAGAGALTGLGVAGLLAGTGVARGLKDGSAAAAPWRPIIAGVTDDIHRLQDTAAAGVLPGVEKTFDRLQVSMPLVDRGIAAAADDLGRMLPTGLDTVVTLAERGVPLWQSGAAWLGRMVDGLDDFAHSDAYKGFIDYTVRNGPKTEQFLLHVLQLVGDIITAWAPYGEEVLPVLDGTVQTVGQLIKVLGPAVPAVAAVYLAFRAYTGVRTVIDGITTGLRLMGVEAVASGEKVAAAEAMAGRGGGRLTVAGLKGAGAVVGGAAVLGAYQAADSSTATKSRITGQIAKGKQVQAVASTFNANVFGGGGSGFAFGTTFADQDKQLAQLVKSGNAQKAAQMWAAMGKEAATDGIKVGQLTAAYPRYAAAIGGTATKTQSATSATDRLIIAYGEESAALNRVYAAQEKASAGAVSHELAVDGLKDSIAAVSTAVKQNGTSLDQNTVKGRANRAQIAQAVSTINDYAAAQSNGGKDAAKFTQVQYTQAAALEKTMVQAGYSKKAAAEYIAQLLHIPVKKATVLQLEKTAAQAKLDAFKAKWDAMQSKTITLFARTNTVNDSGLTAKGYGVMAQGGTTGVTRAATGMTVRGPGNAASDQAGMYALANGEEITSNLRGQADRFRTVLKAINSGAVRSPAELGAALTGGQPVRMHFTSDGSREGDIAKAAAESAVAHYEALAFKTVRGGYRPKGVLAGAGS